MLYINFEISNYPAGYKNSPVFPLSEPALSQNFRRAAPGILYFFAGAG
jgi:hypothetical protein